LKKLNGPEHLQIEAVIWTLNETRRGC
jgi:hypothetical protein